MILKSIKMVQENLGLYIIQIIKNIIKTKRENLTLYTDIGRKLPVVVTAIKCKFVLITL